MDHLLGNGARLVSLAAKVYEKENLGLLNPVKNTCQWHEKGIEVLKPVNVAKQGRLRGTGGGTTYSSMTSG